LLNVSLETVFGHGQSRTRQSQDSQDQFHGYRFETELASSKVKLPNVILGRGQGFI
jgi:hypothetical protein